MILVTQALLKGSLVSCEDQTAADHRTLLTEHTPQVRGCLDGPWETLWRQWSVNGLSGWSIHTSLLTPVSRVHVIGKHLRSTFCRTSIQFTFPSYTDPCEERKHGASVQWHMNKSWSRLPLSRGDFLSVGFYSWIYGFNQTTNFLYIDICLDFTQ
jgi:hypothetical protein